MSATFNSFTFCVRDSIGQEFLHTIATNRPGAVESAKSHAKWWLAHRRRPAAHRDRDPAGNRLRSPVGKTEVVVEYYDHPSAK